jgi:ABC-type transporter Mla subunit MlaD
LFGVLIHHNVICPQLMSATNANDLVQHQIQQNQQLIQRLRAKSGLLAREIASVQKLLTEVVQRETRLNDVIQHSGYTAENLSCIAALEARVA